MDRKMSKELLIMRHAKSSWDNPNVSDHDRPLNRRGLKTAPSMSQWLVTQDLLPDRVLSSTAQRALSTAEIMLEGFRDSRIELDVHAALYHAAAEEYLRWLSLLPDGVHRAMVVGHNPGLEELVLALTGFDVAMPTAAIAHVILEIDDWKNLVDGKPGKVHQLIGVYRPKDLFDCEE
jgi:phosphohistidine phosphatase